MIALNQLPAVSVRRLTTWQGAWIADVDIELDETGIAPSGPCTITIGAATLVGTLDPDASGMFGSGFRARVVAGGGGWQKDVPPQAFHNDGGVAASVPILATAALVKEVAVVAAPSIIGTDFARFQGPAWQVFRGLDWHVDAQGITQVAPRIPTPVVDPDVQVLSFDGLMQTAEIATDSVLEPGMVLTDPKFGTLTIRQVEQRFSADGARATVWVSSSDSVTHSLGAVLAKVARVAVGLGALRAYRYRVVAQNGDGRLLLQAVSKSAGIPDQLPITILYGVPGLSAKVTPSMIVELHFQEGNPSQPVVAAFDATVPIEIDIEAAAAVNVKAPLVALGEVAPTGVATLETTTPLLAAVLELVIATNVLAVAVNNIIGTPNVSFLSIPAAIDPTTALSTAVTAGFAGVQTAAAEVESLLPEPTNFSQTVSAAP